MLSIAVACAFAIPMGVAQPVYAGTGVSKISIKMPTPIKGSDKNKVVINKGEKTTFVVKLTGYSGKPLYQSDCKTVFTPSSKTKATVGTVGYKKKNSNVYWADVPIKANDEGKFELKAKVKKKNLYVYWTVCVSTCISDVFIEQNTDDLESEDKKSKSLKAGESDSDDEAEIDDDDELDEFEVGDVLIARASDQYDDWLTTALVNFEWYLIDKDGNEKKIERDRSTAPRDEELIVTQDMVGYTLKVKAKPSSYLTGSAEYISNGPVLEAETDEDDEDEEDEEVAENKSSSGRFVY